MKKVIGIVGKNGSGKDTAAKMLAKKLGAQIVVYSAIIDQALTVFLEKEDIGRVDQSGLATYLRSRYGDGIIAKGVKKALDQKSDGIYILVGARDNGDYDLIRSFPNSLFLAVCADVHTRWERVISRKEKADDNISLEDFLEKERLASELLIDSLIEHADHIIDNSGSLKDLEEVVDSIIKKIMA